MQCAPGFAASADALKFQPSDCCFPAFRNSQATRNDRRGPSTTGPRLGRKLETAPEADARGLERFHPVEKVELSGDIEDPVRFHRREC